MTENDMDLAVDALAPWPTWNESLVFAPINGRIIALENTRVADMRIAWFAIAREMLDDEALSAFLAQPYCTCTVEMLDLTCEVYLASFIA